MFCNILYRIYAFFPGRWLSFFPFQFPIVVIVMQYKKSYRRAFQYKRYHMNSNFCTVAVGLHDKNLIKWNMISRFLAFNRNSMAYLHFGYCEIWHEFIAKNVNNEIYFLLILTIWSMSFRKYSHFCSAQIRYIFQDSL